MSRYSWMLKCLYGLSPKAEIAIWSSHLTLLLATLSEPRPKLFPRFAIKHPKDKFISDDGRTKPWLGLSPTLQRYRCVNKARQCFSQFEQKNRSPFPHCLLCSTIILFPKLRGCTHDTGLIFVSEYRYEIGKSSFDSLRYRSDLPFTES